MSKSVITHIALPYRDEIRIHRTRSDGREYSRTYSRLERSRSYQISEVVNSLVNRGVAILRAWPDGWECQILNSFDGTL